MVPGVEPGHSSKTPSSNRGGGFPSRSMSRAPSRPPTPPAGLGVPPPRPPRSPYRHRAALPHSRSRSQSRSPTPAPRRSQRSTKGKAPARPGNIYGEQRHPTDIEVDTRQIKRWESLVESEPSSPEPGPSRLPGGFETPAVSPQQPPAPLPPQSPVPKEGVFRGRV